VDDFSMQICIPNCTISDDNPAEREIKVEYREGKEEEEKR